MEIVEFYSALLFSILSTGLAALFYYYYENHKYQDFLRLAVLSFSINILVGIGTILSALYLRENTPNAEDDVLITTSYFKVFFLGFLFFAINWCVIAISLIVFISELGWPRVLILWNTMKICKR
jgi:hypothetical protein